MLCELCLASRWTCFFAGFGDALGMIWSGRVERGSWFCPVPLLCCAVLCCALPEAVRLRAAESGCLHCPAVCRSLFAVWRRRACGARFLVLPSTLPLPLPQAACRSPSGDTVAPWVASRWRCKARGPGVSVSEVTEVGSESNARAKREGHRQSQRNVPCLPVHAGRSGPWLASRCMSC